MSQLSCISWKYCQAILGCLTTAAIVAACATTPPAVPAYSPLDATPDLSTYTQYEIFSQADTAANAKPLRGSLSYRASSSLIELQSPTGAPAGRLHLQPEGCRDDPSAACERRFVITGRLDFGNSSMNCQIQVRNDTKFGYAGQTLVGICQDTNRRTHTINLFNSR